MLIQDMRKIMKHKNTSSISLIYGVSNSPQKTYTHASFVGISAGIIVAITNFLDEKQTHNKTQSLIKSTFSGLRVAIKESVKFILTSSMQNMALHTFRHKHTILQDSIKNNHHNLMTFGFQFLFTSANDIIKWSKGDMENRECLNKLTQNIGAVAGSMAISRGCMLLGNAIIPGIGGITLGVAGSYLGDYIGRKITNKIVLHK